MTEKNESTAPAPMTHAQTLEALRKAQGEMTDKDFCREFNFAFHETTWSKIHRGKYTGDQKKAAAACQAMLRRICERKARAGKVRQGKLFIEFTPMQTILDRITVLLEIADTTQNRLLLYLAPPGGGKSGLCREAVARNGGAFIEARESWRDSYFAALSDVCTALKVEGDNVDRVPRAAEIALIKHLRAKKMVIAIDEGEYFGPRSLNLIKLILNQTPTIVLIGAIPALWARVQGRAYAEAMQIMRRTDHVERLEAIQPDEVQQFLAETGINLNGSAAASAKIVARYANEFGFFDTVSRIAKRLDDGEPHTSDEVETIALAVKAMMTGIGGMK